MDWFCTRTEPRKESFPHYYIERPPISDFIALIKTKPEVTIRS
jgi:hypothetical protein